MSLPSSFDTADQNDLNQLVFHEKIIKHCKQQPLVPLGVLGTTGAIILAIKNMKNGDKRRANYWFRWRVGLQGATVVALVIGSLVYGGTSAAAKKTQDDLNREKAKQREALWIQELERRDEESKARRKKAEDARSKSQQMAEESSKLQEELKKLEEEIKLSAQGKSNKD
ncbi:Respiratory supercomplex factor 1, mitochondrial [Hanseniaspora vineae]